MQAAKYFYEFLGDRKIPGPFQAAKEMTCVFMTFSLTSPQSPKYQRRRCNVSENWTLIPMQSPRHVPLRFTNK